MTDPTLLEIVKEVRWKTLKLLENLSESQALFVPETLANHILWHAGHSLVVVEGLACNSLASTELGRVPPFPREWIDLFRGGSNPAAVTAWPALSDIVAALIAQRTRLLGLLDTPDDLNRIVGPAPRNRTLRGTIVHALHDEAGHQGEIHLLKKLAGLKA
jgi:hypothetical protein